MATVSQVIMDYMVPQISLSIQFGLLPVEATQRTRESLLPVLDPIPGGLSLAFVGHSDVRGALFGLGPGERTPDVDLLQGWIEERGLDINKWALRNSIRSYGTVRGDFGFTEETTPRVLKAVEDTFDSEQMTKAIFGPVDRKLNVKYRRRF